MRWILIPLAGAILVLITVISFLLYRDAQARMTSESAEAFGRETCVLEMKQEVNDLLAQLGQERKYEHA